MKLRIFVNPSRLRRWHLDLARALQAGGHAVAFAFAEGGPVLPPSLRLHLFLERLFGAPRNGPSSRIDFTWIAAHAEPLNDPDAVIDLTVIGAGLAADAAPVSLDRRLRLLFDGSPDERAAVASLCSGRLPAVTVVDGLGRGLVDRAASPATDGTLSSQLDGMFVLASRLLCEALARIEAAPDVEVVVPPACPVSLSAKMLVAFALSRQLRLLGAGPSSG